jgi:hypothetical protein
MVAAFVAPNGAQPYNFIGVYVAFPSKDARFGEHRAKGILGLDFDA